MKMPAKIENKTLATCGINCQFCHVHLKEKNACPGCWSNSETMPNHCRNCKIKECSNSLGHPYCFECEDFPCILIKRLDKSYKKYNHNLIQTNLFIKENGIEEFQKSEKIKRTCECGGVVSLIDKVCSECKKAED